MPLLALVASHATAEPGDTTYVYTSFGPFPFYSAVVQFADLIAGSANGGMAQSSAYRFTAQASGPLEYINVALYAPGGSGTEASVNVVLYSDAGNMPGARLGEFPITDLVVGSFKGYFATNNYGNVEPNETTIPITKGLRYWLGVEPLHTNSLAYWAQTNLNITTKRVRTVGGQSSSDNRHSPDAMTISVFEPYPPQVQNPGVPLVEGEQVPAEAQGVKLASVGVVPQAPCLGKIAIGRTKTPVILGADGKVKLRVGDAAPTLAGTAITKLGEPSGDVVLATLRRQTAAPAVTAANDFVLIGGIKTPPLRIIARSGELIAGGNGAAIKKFIALDGGGTSTFFLTRLTGTGVTTKNDTALAAAAGLTPAHLLVREEDTVGTAKVTIISTLIGLPTSTGEGRWRASDSALGVRLKLSDQSDHLFTIPATASTQGDWSAWAATGTTLGTPLAGAVIKSIGAPGFGPDGVVFPATLQNGTGAVTKADDTVLLHQTASGITLLAREGSDAPDDTGTPLTAAKFKTLGNPVYGPAGKVAFPATLTAKTNASGIWWLDGTNPLRLIVRAGDAAPTLGTFAKFTNLILPNAANSTPIFQATLVAQPAVSVTGTTSAGIWALDNAGNIALLARNGGYIYLNSSLYGTLTGITALTTTADSSGAAHGLDGDGSVRINATIANRATPGKKRAQFAIPIPQP